VAQGATTDPVEHPWAGQAAYADLVQRCTLRGGPAPRAVTLRFSSPTLFRNDGRDQPLPAPELVFGGLLRKWNAFAPIALPEEALRYAAECVALGRFALHSRLISFEAADKGAHVGCVGEGVTASWWAMPIGHA
jgi:CRISPR-associated endoribonuclease Cas6